MAMVSPLMFSDITFFTYLFFIIADNAGVSFVSSFTALASLMPVLNAKIIVTSSVLSSRGGIGLLFASDSGLLLFLLQSFPDVLRIDVIRLSSDL